MKDAFRSFITFTRAERIGILVLCLLIAVLIAIRATLFLWVHPSVDTARRAQLQAAWLRYENLAPAEPKHPGVPDTLFYKTGDNATPIPDPLNINTADSAVLVRLRGIGPATAHKIMERRKKKPFTSVKQLLEIDHFPKKYHEQFAPHLSVQ
jgi:DNA uptake protein ComE-like DNA-binding protein